MRTGIQPLRLSCSFYYGWVMTFSNTSTGAVSHRACEAAQQVEALAARTDRVEGENRFLWIVVWPAHICGGMWLPTPNYSYWWWWRWCDDAAAKCNKYYSLSLQKETKHWPGYLRPMAFQEHSDDDVHPSEAGPQALESSSTESRHHIVQLFSLWDAWNS